MSPFSQISSDRKLALLAFTGRFQPFHLDHLAMVQYALQRAAHVVIGVTNPDPRAAAAHPASAHRHLASANPLSYRQRADLIATALRTAGIADSDYSITPFPLEDPAHWPALIPRGTPQLVRVFSDWEREKQLRFEAAGYPVLVLQGDAAARISASDIRRCASSGEPWQHWVAPSTQQKLTEWLSPHG